jgi:hypothetical protein
MSNNLSFFGKLRARRLMTTVYVLISFVALFLISLLVFYVSKDSVVNELFLGIFTSILASILLIVFELYTKYKEFENVEFIDNLYSFGIHNLHFDKKAILENLLPKADKQIWISGYRLILTSEVAKLLLDALDRGVSVRMLVCPPWETAYCLTYGMQKGIIDNYFKIFSILNKTENKEKPGMFEVGFTNKPLFNDSYRIDDKIVTSPFMHNTDIVSGVMTAHDFFTYELDEKYRLFQLIEEEYKVLWQSCSSILNLEDLGDLIDNYNTVDMNDGEKISLLRKVVDYKNSSSDSKKKEE